MSEALTQTLSSEQSIWSKLFTVALAFVAVTTIQIALYIHKTTANRKTNIASYHAFMQANPTIQQHNNLLTTNDPSTKNKLCVSIVLGSGGHTSEILSVTRQLPRLNIAKLNYFYANTDYGSKVRSEQQELELAMFYPEATCEKRFIAIPRARNVGQSYFTSIFTTLWSFFITLIHVVTTKQHILIVNGPGSCVPVCIATILCNAFGLSDTTIIFIESLTRVKQLSLSGKILYYLVDRFIVHWPQLQEKFPLSEYLGIIY